MAHVLQARLIPLDAPACLQDWPDEAREGREMAAEVLAPLPALPLAWLRVGPGGRVQQAAVFSLQRARLEVVAEAHKPFRDPLVGVPEDGSPRAVGDAPARAHRTLAFAWRYIARPTLRTCSTAALLNR